MVVNKPSIYIYVNEPNQEVLREICSGIEEEGVFFEVIEQETQDLNTLTWKAANDSMLGSGIGLKGNSAAFLIRGLKLGKNIAYYAYPSKEESRNLGMNSARAIKKQAFKNI